MKRFFALTLSALIAISAIEPLAVFAAPAEPDVILEEVDAAPTQTDAVLPETEEALYETEAAFADTDETESTEASEDTTDELLPEADEPAQSEGKREATIEVGVLSADASHPTQESDGMIWTTSVGSVGDTWTDYYAVSDDCVSIIKKGTDTPVGIAQLTNYGTTDGILLNRGSNTFCIRNSQWNLNCAGHSSISPMETGDIIIVSGEFYSKNGTRIHVSTTYITKDENGTLHFSGAAPTEPTEAPTEPTEAPTEPTTAPTEPTEAPGGLIEAGVMNVDEAHPKLNSGSFYFTMEDNDIPYTDGDWDNAFYATSADCLKLIRDSGEATPIAISSPGRGVFVKVSSNLYYMNTGSAWFIGSYSPLRAGDKLIVEGSFTNGTVTFRVTKSTVRVEADGSLIFNESETPTEPTTAPTEPTEAPTEPTEAPTEPTEAPTEPTEAPTEPTEAPTEPTEAPVVLEAGKMYVDDGHPKLNNGSFYFTMDENEIPYTDGDWENAFYATSEDCIKLTRDGAETSVAIPTAGRGVFVKVKENLYYLNTGNPWFIGDSAPLREGDKLTVEGNFTNGEVIFHVTKSTIEVEEDGSLSFNGVKPVQTTVYEVGMMHRSDHEPTSDGLFFTMDENDVPIDTGWSTRYAPVSADVILRTRNGLTTSVGNSAGGTILKYSASGWYIAYWAIGGALQPGDVLTVKGDFTAGNVIIRFPKNVIEMNADGSLTVNGEAPPAGPTVIEAGVMQKDTRQMMPSGIYFRLNENEAPYNSDWTLYYRPEATECVKLVRNGVTMNAGNPLADTIAKFSNTEYYLKTETWMKPDAWPTQEGDILIVEGNFVNEEENVILHFDTNYIAIIDGEAVFSTEYPVIPGPTEPTTAPTEPTEAPTEPTTAPTEPTEAPTEPTSAPTEPTEAPTEPTEAPTEPTEAPAVLEAGKMYVDDGHPKLNNGSFYFTMDENEIPYTDGDWSNAFYATSEDCIKLTRDGAETSVAIPTAGRGVFVKVKENLYYLNTGNPWFIGDSAPLREGDKLTVEGNFTNGTVTFHVTKSTIEVEEDGSLSFNGVKPDPTIIYEVGLMHRSSKEPTSDGFFFTMDENDVPIDTGWSTRYAPVSADVILRTRDGITTSVGNTAGGTILKYAANDWYIANWAIGGALQPGDTLTIEGDFTAGNVIIRFPKNVIEMNADGSLTVNGEKPPAGPTVIEAGVMQKDSRQLLPSGIYFRLDENEAPFNSDWSVYYRPESADCIKLVRDGVTMNAGNPLADTIAKFSNTEYYLKTEEWMKPDAWPLQERDILIIEGNFVNREENVILHFDTNYIAIIDGEAVFSTEYPELPQPHEPILYEVGQMHRSSKAPAADGLFFTMDKNDVPTDATWETRYIPVSRDVIQRTRDGVTTSVGNPAAGTILKYSDTDWYMAYWAIGGALQPGDVLTVEGDFSMGDVTVRFPKNVIEVNEDGSLTVNGEEPPPAPTIIEAGVMQKDRRGRTENGIYFDMEENAAPYDSGWSLYYRPVNAECILLTRNGETTAIGNPAADTFTKFSETEYFLKTEEWMMRGAWPLQEGDILTVSGNFANTEKNVIVHIDTSYIKIRLGQPVFSSEYPTDEPIEVIQAGYMKQDSRPRTSTGIFFTMDENAAPYAKDWTLEYKPMSTACVKLIRNGETYEVAIPERGTITKFNETGYYLKTDTWAMGDMMPVQVGDILVVEGQFVNGETVMEISRSYVSIRSGKTVISTEYPDDSDGDVIEAGVMKPHPVNTGLYVDSENGTCGIYFTMDENAVPEKASDPWNNRFYPVDADCIKLYRNGEEISIANPDAGEIVKFNATAYYLALDRWAHPDVYPITDSDVLLVEGEFTDGSTVFHISRSYVSFLFGAARFTEEYPDGSSDIKIVPLSNIHSDSRGKLETGAYFDAAVNEAPYDRGWTLAYSPLEASSFKLIRNGQTYEVGKPGRETIVKFSATEYFVKADAWSMGSFAPLRDGDVLVIEGQFANGGAGVVIDVPTTYIGIWYGKAFVTSYYMAGPAISVVNTGEMLADERDLPGSGLYFDMEENAAPADRTWKQEYSPVSADCLKLIRDGKTHSIGIPSHGTIVKFTATEYFLKLDPWSIGSYVPIRDGDILIIGGSFINVGEYGGTMLNIPETYVFFRNGKAIIAKSMGEVELAEDESLRLAPENVPEGETVVWLCENEKRLRVDENGNVTALSNRGKIRVFATVGKASYFWTVKMYEETEFGKVYLPSSDNDLPFGVWCGSYHAFTNKELDRLADAGVTLLIGVKEEQTGDGGMWSLLNRARDHGISVIADIIGWDGETQFTYARHPALKGFLVWNDPSSADLEALAALKTSFDALMPEELDFYVQLGAKTVSYEALSDGSAAEDVSAFIRAVQPDQISFTSDAPEKDGDGFKLPEAYFNLFGVLAQSAKNAALPLTYTMPVADTDEALLRWQAALGLTFGATSVNHYAYATAQDGSDAMVDPDSHKATDLLDDIETVNREYRSWSDIILSYFWLGISKADVGQTNPLLEALKTDVPVSTYGWLADAESDRDLLIGSYVNEFGEYAYMITNADAAASADGFASLAMAGGKVTLTLMEGDYRCVALIRKGEITYVAVGKDRTVSFELDANEGVFVIPMMN
ncbi:MAG: hypothetical protein IJG45_03635 [Oscillospiraceae bacterium]|nr:hypothetical protein [Oscillospiraceae bacterium]